MNCPLCHSLIIEDAKKMDMTCCSATCHTNCFFQNARITGDMYRTIVTCPCCNDVYQTMLIHVSELGLEPEAIPEITPALRAGIRKVKKATAAKNKGFLLAKSAIKAAHDAFKAQSAPLRMSLKAMKREAILGVKLTEGFREGVRSFRSLTMIRKQFEKDFHIQNMHAGWLGFRRIPRFGWTPIRLLKRKFRIRI